MDEYQEDPVEVYKREFQRKRWEKEQAEKAKADRSRRATHKYFRYISFATALFAVVVLLDKYLPGEEHTEVPLKGWQERGPRSKYNQGTLYSHMDTENFDVVVPSELHINYPYNEDNRPPLTITTSPIFGVPKQGAMNLGDHRFEFILGDTIHSMTYLVWALLILSLATIIVRNYSIYTYYLSYAPILLSLLTILKIYT